LNFTDNTVQKVYQATKNTLVGTKEPLVSSSGRYFVFTNIFDNYLYSLDLGENF